MMTIGILGSGNVGGALGSRWAEAGHKVLFSSRNPDSAEMKNLLGRAGANARAVRSPEAAAGADIILLASPWPATRPILEAAGSLAGKILIDATNPLLPDLSGLELGTNTSGAEQVALWAPGAVVVKAFNTVGAGVMADPLFPGGPAMLLYCGDDRAAKGTVHGLAEQLGFQPHDAGPLTMARTLEPLALLWVSLAYQQGYGVNFSFGLTRR